VLVGGRHGLWVFRDRAETASKSVSWRGAGDTERSKVLQPVSYARRTDGVRAIAYSGSMEGVLGYAEAWGGCVGI